MSQRGKQTKIKTLVKNEVKAAMNRSVEEKYFDAGLSSTVTSSGTMIPLSQVPQGTTGVLRIGNSILKKKIVISYDMRVNAADFWNFLRVIVFTWKGDDLSDAPTAGSILDGNVATWVYLAQAPHNFAYRHKYRILYDKLHQLETGIYGAALAANFGQVKSAAFQPPTAIKLNGEVVFYPGVNTGMEGELYALVISDSLVAGHPAFNFASQLIFTDS